MGILIPIFNILLLKIKKTYMKEIYGIMLRSNKVWCWAQVFDLLYAILVFMLDTFQNKKTIEEKKTTENIKRPKYIMFLNGKTQSC